jgi:hypothetical protein
MMEGLSNLILEKTHWVREDVEPPIALIANVKTESNGFNKLTNLKNWRAKTRFCNKVFRGPIAREQKAPSGKVKSEDQELMV